MEILDRVIGLLKRARQRHPLEILKYVELELLGKYASTYCYHHPSHVQIELTTKCNLRCKWCNQSDPGWQKEYGHKDMPFEVFRRIMPQLRGSNVLLLYNIGEPLLYKRIYDAIALARQYIPQVRFTSNALLLTPEIAQKLETAGLTQLNVSIDAPDNDLMMHIRGADLGQIKDNLLAFGLVCSIPVETWSVISSGNIAQLKGLPEWCSQIPAIKSLYFQLQNGVDNGTAIGLPTLVSEAHFRELQASITADCTRLGLKTNINSLAYYPPGFNQRQAEGICKAPFTQLVAINVAGQLAPCCSYATVNLGDVNQNGFKKSWNGPAMRAWRKDMLEQKYCAYCSEWCGYKQHDTSSQISITELKE